MNTGKSCEISRETAIQIIYLGVKQGSIVKDNLNRIEQEKIKKKFLTDLMLIPVRMQELSLKKHKTAPV